MTNNKIRANVQVRDNSITKSKIVTDSEGESLVTNIIAGSGITIVNTGADSGTGQVTISVSGVGEYLYSKWDPDVPPTSGYAYDDEFDDASLDAKWTPTGGADTSITYNQDNNSAHYNESMIPGWILLQVCGISQTIALDTDFTVIVKATPGFVKVTSESYMNIQLIKDATHFYYIRLGYYSGTDYDDQVRTVYNNGSGAAQGVLLDTSNFQYTALSWDDSETKLYAFISGDGIAWELVEARVLNAISDWTQLKIDQSTAGTPEGVGAVDFVRFSLTLCDLQIGGGEVGVYGPPS